MEVKELVLTTGVITALLMAVVATTVSHWIRSKKGQMTLPKRYKKVAKVVKVIIYPVKSLPGIEVENAVCTPVGLKLGKVHDRMWMIAKQGGGMITLRNAPQLALLKTSIHGDEVWIDGPNMPTLKLDVITKYDPKYGKPEFQKVWDQTVQVVNCEKNASEWFQQYLGQSGIKLVQYLTEFPLRPSRIKYNTSVNPVDYPVMLQDGTSYHLFSQASIDHLNSLLEEPVTYRNFRPNILVEGCKPYDEDGWEFVRIGESVVLIYLKSCERCILTTVNPDTGVKTEKDPLVTLRKYRLGCNPGLRKAYGQAPLFGVQLGLITEGAVQVGNEVSLGICS